MNQLLVGYSMTTFAQNAWMRSQSQGFLKLNDSATINEHSAFHAGAISKLITAIVTMQLVSERVLQLDTPIDTLPIPGITVRHLLAHCSGFTDELPHTPIAAPGQQFHLADVNYRILEQYIEYKTTRHFVDLVHEYVFERLAMTNSFYAIPSTETTAGHTKQLHIVTPTISSPAVDGLWTSSYDLAKLCAALSQNLRVESVLCIKRSLVKQMFSPQFGFKWLGLGFYFEQEEATMLSTSSGYRAMISIHLRKESGYVAFSNCELSMLHFHELIAKTIAC